MPPPRRQNTEAELTRLTSWTRPQLDLLTDRIHANCLSEMAAYRDGSMVPSEDLRRSIANNLQVMLRHIANPASLIDTTVPADTGRRRARQGMPLPEVLRAYRLTFTGLWELLARHSDDDSVSERSLLEAATRLWKLSDEHAMLLTEGYRSQTLELLAAQHRRRVALVEALFTGEHSAQADIWETSQLLGLPPGAKHRVVAAETQGLAEESLPGIEGCLAAAGIPSAWRLTPSLQLGIVAITEGRDDSVHEALRDLAQARVGVSPPYRALAETPRALHLARMALSGIPARTIQVHAFPQDPLAAMLACSPVEASRLVDTVLGGVLELPKQDRDMLMETLECYLKQDASAEVSGRQLHCHANTVRYRLRRVEQLTGRAPSDPAQLTELTAALIALRVLPDRDRV